MKHIFLVNSFSLREKTSSMINKIKNIATSFKLDYIIEVNDKYNSTEDIVSKYKKSENIIYAIGGDGVINRVLNAMIGSKNILGSPNRAYFRADVMPEGETLADDVKLTFLPAQERVKGEANAAVERNAEVNRLHIGLKQGQYNINGWKTVVK